MAEIEDKIRRSDAVQEMLGKSPSWIVRTGGVLLALWIMVLIVLSFMIRYPEILEGPINITTKTPPADLISKASGRITLLVQNNDKVRKDQVLGYIKNTASHEEIIALNEQMSIFQELVAQPTHIRTKLSTFQKFSNLGPVQNAYNNFLNKLYSYDLTYSLEKNRKLASDHMDEVATLEKKELLLQDKEKLLQQELSVLEDNYKKDQSLFERGHISKTEFDESRFKYFQIKKNLQSNKQSSIENKQILQHLKYNVNELNLNDTEQKESLNVHIISAFNLLVSELKAYKEEYLFTAPFAGTVSFFDVWNNNQFVKEGDPVAFVVVDSGEILGKLQVKGNKFGKVKMGQKVRVKLNSFPMSEYGVLMGKVNNISKVNRNNIYVIDVSLNPKLITTYKKKIPYYHEMKGMGEIITEDVSFIKRIFYQLRAVGRKELMSDEETLKFYEKH